MIAVDTNILVHAHRADSQWHPAATQALQELEVQAKRWAIPWPCLYEFYGVVTHPSIFAQPTPPKIALATIAGWLKSPHLRLISEEAEHFPKLQELINGLDLRGPRIHDARIAVLCSVHGVRELWSMDRDFSRFPFLRTRNPLC